MLSQFDIGPPMFGILCLLIAIVKYIDYRQTLWIFRNPGFRELNPLITSETRIVPVMVSITGMVFAAGWFEPIALWAYLAVSLLIVIRNWWIGIRCE